MLIAVVSDLAVAGRIDEAWEVAENITDYYCRAHAALIIARETGESHDFENAMILASHIDDEVRKRELEAEIERAKNPA